MNTKHAIRIVKNGKRKVPAIPPLIKSATGPDRWSTAVQSWVSEFQKHRRHESLPAFDSLFSDAPMQLQNQLTLKIKDV